MEVKYSTCPLCEANCGIEVHTEKNSIVKILGDKKDPLSKGYMCVKARALKDLHEDKDRLRKPLIREGENWREVSWNEALDFAAKGIRKLQQKYGNDAIGFYQGNPLGHSSEGVLYYWLLTKSLKTRNVFSSASLDQLPHMIVADKLYGSMGMFTIPDIDRTSFMVLLGANPLVSNGSIMTAPNVRRRLKNIKERNGKIVVIDPVKTETAKIANQHIAIQPGTDAYFLMAFIHILFKESLVELGHLKPVVKGIEKIEKLAKLYSPLTVENVTGIRASVIEKLAIEFSKADSAVLYPRIGASSQEFGTLTHWLVHIINIITNNLDKEGGMMFSKPAIDFIKIADFMGESGNFGNIKSRVNKYPSFRNEFPVSALIDELKTKGNNQIKGMITIASNPVLSSPNSKELEKSIQDLEFMVSVDIYKNETTSRANVILPPCFTLEGSRFETVFPIMSVRNRIKYSEPVINKSKESKTDGAILRALVQRLGSKFSFEYIVTNFFPINFLLDFVLRFGFYGNKFNPFSKKLSFKKVKKTIHGIDLGPLKPMLPNRLFTKNKKINLAHDLFFKDEKRLMKRRGELENKISSKNEFLLIGRRTMRFNNTWFHNLPLVNNKKEKCELIINPIDADNLKIIDGQIVKVSTKIGSVKVGIKISDEIKKGVVCLPFGWGHNKVNANLSHARKNPGVNINEIIDHKLVDELSGASILNGISVKIFAIP